MKKPADCVWQRMCAPSTLAGIALASALALSATPATAIYIVAAQTVNFTDGAGRDTDTNGATIITRTTSESNATRVSNQFAQGDLANGLVRARAAGTQLTGSVFSLAQGFAVDTLQFDASQPFNWSFRLSVDGTVIQNQPQSNGFPNNSLFFTAALFVYDVTTGPTGFTVDDYFSNQPSAEFFMEDVREFGDSTFFNIDGLLAVPAGISRYEVLLSMRTFSGCQGNSLPGCSFDVDFSNTASFFQNFDPSVASQTSDSGVFPVRNFVAAAVPEPGSLALAGLALAALGFVRRRKSI